MNDKPLFYKDAKTQEVLGCTVNYVQKGTGPAVLLLHGIPLCAMTWKDNVDAIATNRTVVAVDMPGYGYSDKNIEKPTLDYYAELFVKFMETLKFNTFSIIGSSFGCAVALQIAKSYPNKVKQLMLINSVGFPSSRHSFAQMSRISVMRNFAKILLKTKRIGKKIFTIATKKSYSIKKLTNEELLGYYNAFLYRDGVGSYLKTLVNFNEHQVEQLLDGVKNEVIIVWGAKDKLLPVTNAEKFAKKLEKVHIVVMKACGHMPHEDDSEAFNEIANKYLYCELASVSSV